MARTLLAGLALATAGALVPLGIMIHGAIAGGTAYYAWSWSAIPAVWLLVVGALALHRRAPTVGAWAIVVAASAGVAVFRDEYGALTFGPLWLFGVIAYLRAAGSVFDVPRRAWRVRGR